MMLHVLIAMIAGWINRHQQQIITNLCYYQSMRHKVLSLLESKRKKGEKITGACIRSKGRRVRTCYQCCPTDSASL